jgi:hypothetical protein
MRPFATASAWLLLALLAGCATMAHPISPQQARTFRETVRVAEQANAFAQSGPAAESLREAKSDFYYAEHSPMNPERASQMAARAPPSPRPDSKRRLDRQHGLAVIRQHARCVVGRRAIRRHRGLVEYAAL